MTSKFLKFNGFFIKYSQIAKIKQLATIYSWRLDQFVKYLSNFLVEVSRHCTLQEWTFRRDRKRKKILRTK